MWKRTMIAVGVALMWAFLGGRVGQAKTIIFDFEDQELMVGLATLSVSTAELTMTITRPDDTFGLTDVVGGEFGTRSLTPFFPGTTQHTPFIADFSSPVTSVSIDAGDFVQFSSELDTLLVEAFSGPSATGTLLTTSRVSCCQSGDRFAFGTVTVSVPGIMSIRFIGGSEFAANSVYYDNIAVTLEDTVVDADKDEFSDEMDACLYSDLYDTVVISGCDSQSPNTLFPDGCTTADLVMVCAEDARNHGAFMNCVAELTNELKRNGTITGQQKGAIQNCAAQSNLP